MDLDFIEDLMNMIDGSRICWRSWSAWMNKWNQLADPGRLEWSNFKQSWNWLRDGIYVVFGSMSWMDEADKCEWILELM